MSGFRVDLVVFIVGSHRPRNKSHNGIVERHFVHEHKELNLQHTHCWKSMGHYILGFFLANFRAITGRHLTLCELGTLGIT
jgi:hypothetical protein